ncbi:hypothetical protein F4780DRAFT_781292 [Xylariomycetidae sp. FL0641]|nr:hypothetical protein F4780DRAFT_781292 [Xylariomycetidae sp. FL0641]
MHPFAFLLPLGAVLAAAAPNGNPKGDADQQEQKLPQPDVYEAIHQAEFRLAVTLDEKKYNELYLSMTNDVIYNNSQFLEQGRPGGIAWNLEQVIESTKAAFGDALVSHSVTTAKIDLLSETKAHVITYLIYSHWDPTALEDDTKTFRIWEECDDIWVLQDGLWKLQYSLVTDMAPNFEWPDVRVPKDKQNW